MSNFKNTILQHIIMNSPKISRAHHEIINGRLSKVLWFTGLPCSGKSTLAIELEKELCIIGYKTHILDGDIIRNGLCNDLGYTDTDRSENLRRIAEVTKLFLEAGITILSAFISPLKSNRDLIHNIIGRSNIIEIYCKCSLSICENRDVKGMYKKARCGEILNFTGINSTYEAPLNPDIILNTGIESIDTCIIQILKYLKIHHNITLEIK